MNIRDMIDILRWVIYKMGALLQFGILKKIFKKS